MRRCAVLLMIALSGVLLPPGSASAFCGVMPLDRAVHRADAVWWGTVTDATASARGSPGTWTLTVRVTDVLKGSEAPGATSRFFVPSCGPYIPPEQAKKDGRHFIGEQRLFVGTYVLGGLAPVSDYFTPQVSSAEQYQLALKDLGLRRPVAATHVQPLGSNASMRVRWVVVAFTVLAAVGILLAVRLRRRTQGRSQ